MYGNFSGGNIRKFDLQGFGAGPGNVYLIAAVRDFNWGLGGMFTVASFCYGE
jgi:hypothetical protein